MRLFLVVIVLAALQIGMTSLRASAGEDHPTVRAAHRFAHRKAARVSNSVYHAGAHYRNWKHRKGHKVRAWLNNH